METRDYRFVVSSWQNCEKTPYETHIKDKKKKRKVCKTTYKPDENVKMW